MSFLIILFLFSADLFFQTFIIPVEEEIMAAEERYKIKKIFNNNVILSDEINSGQVDSRVRGGSEEIIAMVSDQLKEELNQHIRIGLADHIAFSLKRIRDGIEVANPFLAETRTLYSNEYNLAEKSVQMIEKRFNIFIPES